MNSLYEISEEFNELYSLMEEEEVGMDVISDTFESLSYEFEEKAESYVVIMKSLEAEALMLAQEVKRLTARKKSIEANAERLKRSVEKAMIHSGKRKFKTKLFSFSIQKNAPSLGEVNEALLDDEYWVQHDPTVDRVKLLNAVKADPDSFAGIAALVQTESIRIK